MEKKQVAKLEKILLVLEPIKLSVLNLKYILISTESMCLSFTEKCPLKYYYNKSFQVYLSIYL
jgi:hypothetical protein